MANFSPIFSESHTDVAYSAPLDEQQFVSDLQNPAKAQAAFKVLMHTYGEQLYWHIRRIVVSHDDADDILQNSFVKAWTNLPKFRGDAKLSTWLYKIAVNESINYLNKERARRAEIADDEGSSFLMDNLESDTWFDGDQIQKDLQAAIAKLPDKQRLVFNMRYFDEMKYEEMSEVLGTSVGALKASYHFAVKKIESEMGESIG